MLQFPSTLLAVTGLRSPLAVLLCLLPWTAGAANLMQVYQDARQQDPVYASARDAWASTQEKLPQARALLLPSATFSANTNHNDRDIAFRDGTSAPGRFNSNAATVTVTQPLLRMQNLMQYRGAGTQLAQSDFILAAAAQDLIQRVAQAYFDVLLAQDSLELAVAQKAAIQEQLAVAKRNYKLGAAAITDAHDAQARFDLAAALEITAQTDLDNRREALQQITGKPPGALTPLGSNFAPNSPEPQNAMAWVDQSVATSQQIAIQKAAVALAEQEVQRNRYAHYPTLDAVASYSDTGLGQGTLGATGLDTRTTVVGLQFSMPLYLGGSVNSQVRQAHSNLSKARQDLEATRRQVATAVKQAFRGVTTGISQIQALTTALQSSESSLKSSLLGREVGIRTQVDVLNAQQQLFSARFNLAQARYNYIINWLQLKSGSGQLTESDLSQVNAWLDSPGSKPTIMGAALLSGIDSDRAVEPLWRAPPSTGAAPIASGNADAAAGRPLRPNANSVSGKGTRAKVAVSKNGMKRKAKRRSGRSASGKGAAAKVAASKNGKIRKVSRPNTRSVSRKGANTKVAAPKNGEEQKEGAKSSFVLTNAKPESGNRR